MKEFSNSSSDRYSNNSQEGTSPKTSKRNREGQTEQSSSDATHNNMKFEQHIKIFGKKSDQQVGTNETSSSGSDRQSTVLKETDDNKLLLQATDHRHKGEYKEAEQLYRYVLDNCAKEPKPNSPKIELVAHNLAEVYEKQRIYGNAEEIYKSLIEYHANESQQDDIKIGAAINGIGRLYEKQGMYNEARVVFKSVLDIYKDKFGENNLKTASAMKRLAKVHEKIAATSQDNPKKQEKAYAKAEALLREFVLPIYKTTLGENAPRTGKVQEKLINLSEKSGQEMPRGTQKLISERRANPLLKHIMRHKRFPDLRDPKLFNDKARHRDLFDRRPIRRELPNKLTLREYVKQKIGEEYLPKLLCDPTKDPSTIPFKDLPNKFVIKCNQGSCAEQVKIVRDKSTMNESEIIQQCKDWLKNDISQGTGKSRYKNMDKYIMVEEYIDDGKGKGAPYDYKLYNYDGETKVIEVEADRVENYSSTWHDTVWNRLEITHGGEICPTSIDKPPHLEQMLELAQKLGKGLEFARIDLYDTPKGVIVGEISSVPANGMQPFKPPMYERILGEAWKEVYNKHSGPSPVTSSDLPEIIRQITNAMHKSALEGGQNNR